MYSFVLSVFFQTTSRMILFVMVLWSSLFCFGSPRDTRQVNVVIDDPEDLLAVESFLQEDLISDNEIIDPNNRRIKIEPAPPGFPGQRLVSEDSNNDGSYTFRLAPIHYIFQIS